jgi:predicted short-subunit dehydrogenase-like oxidoreductase (DUF2520 family)
MNVVLVGSGNVATHLALALKASGIQVTQVWSKQVQHANTLAALVDANAIEDLSELDHSADFCIVAIKDDSIASIVADLVGFKGIVVHTSGAVDLSVFEGKLEKYGVLYPLQTFSILKPVDFSTIPICIEAKDRACLKLISKLADRLSTQVEEVSSDKRKVLHVAAVFACNFTNHLYALSSELLLAHDLKFDLIRPLILETASKVQHALPIDVQTGPAIRSDEQTLKKHEELLLKQPQLLNIYQILSESIKKTKK